LIICPACGSRVEGQLCLGCPACGARAVGPPLAKPEHQLVSFGRAIAASVAGGFMLAGFLVSTSINWFTKSAVLAFSTVVRAGEVAAWQLKWVSIPIAIAAVWGGSRSLRSIRSAPKTFGGLRLARAGYSMAVVTVLLIGTLIGVTVPERLRRRQWGLQAAENARGYTLSRALLQYSDLHGTLPPQDEMVQQLRTLPDPDGSIAEALRFVDPKGYQATSILAAAAPKTKPLQRGAALRNASLNISPDPPAVSFTNYELRLPGEDKKLNTDDDLIVHDGLVMTATEFLAYRATRTNAR
jgi:hypothetical protein